MSESTQRLSEAARARRPDLDWKAIAGFRNVLVHDYLGIDLQYVSRAVQTDVPALKKACEQLLRDLGD